MPQEPNVQKCTTDLKLLSGCFAWIGEGTDKSNVNTRAVGYFNFDVRGVVTSLYEGSFGGKQVSKTFTGTVTSENNFGKMHFVDNEQAQLSFDFVMAGKGTILYLVNRDEQALQTLTATKV